MRPKILVIRGGAIGDFVLTLPAIKLIRENFPAAHLEILGYPHIAALAKGRFYADEIRSIEYSGLAGFFVPGSELAPDLVAYFSGFQQVVSYLYDPDLFFQANVRRCGVRNFLSVNPVIDNSAHAALQLARPLEQLALYLDQPHAELFPSQADRQFAREFLGEINQPLITIHPGSGSPTKNWPVEYWSRIAGWLLTLLPRPILLLVGGEADDKALAALSRTLPADSVRIASGLPLPQLCALLETSDLFLGHDSGISHIAAAVKTRCILIFGPTDPAIWAPAGDHVELVRAPGGELNRVEPGTIQQKISVLRAWEAGFFQSTR